MAGTSFKQRRGTAQQWSTANPILPEGEIGYEVDTGRVKFGDGANRWNALPVALHSDYLPILGKAADSEKLDGHDSTEFLLKTEGTATYLPLTSAASTYQRQDGIVSAATPNAPVKRDAQGSAAFNEVTLTGQTAAASAARKDYVDTAVSNATASGSASRKLGYFWGSVTAFPAGALGGDTCVRTDIGTSGSLWQYTGVAGIGSNGWISENVVICTSTTRPTAGLYIGLQIYETNTSLGWVYGGSGNGWVPTNAASINGRLWVTANLGLPALAFQTVAFGGSRLFGGFAYDSTNQALKIPLDGFYKIASHTYLYNFNGAVAGSECMFIATRIRSGVANSDFASSMVTFQSRDKQSYVEDPLVALKKDDLVKLQAYAYNAGLAYAANAESNGTNLYVEYKGPLNGTVPI